MKKRQVLISGGGPAGLAAAMLFHKRGWEEIILLERRKSPDEFERGKAFNYQLDARGQRVLQEVGIGHDILKKYGLPNDNFTITAFKSDGRVKVSKPPILIKNRKTSYWTMRTNLLKMLYESVVTLNTDGRIKLLYGHKFEDFVENEDGTLSALVRDAENRTIVFKPELLLGCDGLSSRVRAGLKRLSQSGRGTSENPEDFEMEEYPSPSAELKYRVLNLPARFPVNVEDHKGVDNNEMAYAFYSTYKDTQGKILLFALPVPDPEQPRSVNLILKKDHDFWKLKTTEKVKDYLVEGFPQLDIDNLISADELEEFAALTPGQFPVPQFSRKIHDRFANGHGEGMNCLLIGDAAHAFPPDLGMGVNSALEDLFVLNEELDKSESDLTAACENFQEIRLPENKSLVRLVQTVFPYQYNQSPWHLRLWAAKFMIQLGIHKLTFGMIDEPGFMLTQHHLMKFTEMERRKNKADRVFYISMALTVCLFVLLPALF